MVSLFGISEISISSISFWILYGTLTKLKDIEFKFLLPKYPSNIIYDASVENLLFGSIHQNLHHHMEIALIYKIKQVK